MNTITKIGDVEFNKALMENMAHTTEAVWVIDVQEEKVYILHNSFDSLIEGSCMPFESTVNSVVSNCSEEYMDVARSNLNIERFKQLRETEEFTSEAINENGTRVVLKGVETPDFDEDGNVKFVYISFVSLQDKFELREKRSELDNLLRAVSCGIIKYEKDTSRIIYANDVALKLLGYDSVEQLQELGFNGVATTVYPEDAEMMNELISGLTNEDDKVEYEYRIKHFDGKDVICYGSAQIFTDDTGRVIVQRSMIDVTQSRMFAAEVEKTQKEIEESEKQRKAVEDALIKAERANRSKSLFLGNMSREIRTPLNAIISFASIGLTNIDDKQKVYDSLRKIQLASGHLLSIINDVLDKSLIDSGEMALEEGEMSLTDIINTISKIANNDAKRKQILFTSECDINNNNVIGDKAKLNQIIINGISNSLKFTKENGEISIKLKEIECDGCEAKYELRIKDTGIGMRPEFVEHIFDPFSKESTDLMTTGTGLGMTITSNLVKLMRGTITVETELGKGTEFIIILPFKIQNV